MLQKYELTDKLQKTYEKRNCTEKGAIYVKYALDFMEKSMYNDRKAQYIY